jgi:putative ABC transport system permease protein
VVIVDEMLAQRAWGTTDAVGRKLLVDDPSKPHQWLTVTGVVKHARMHEISVNLREQVYLSALQRPARQMFYTVRTQGDPDAMLNAAISAVHQVDPALAVYQRHSMDYFVSQAMAQTRFVLLLAAIFGVVALVLTAIGIFGLTSYFTSLRTREFGIRVALGAQRGSIYALILREGVMPAVMGATAGVVVALGIGPAIRSLLYGVSPRDPLTLLLTPLLLVFVAALAVLVPARKAVRVDPMVSLRAE